MIQRDIQGHLIELMRQFPAIGILGPRQIGKTTIALAVTRFLNSDAIYLDLESPSDLVKLAEPKLYFDAYQDKTIILDEIQRMPQIFSTLRGVIDHNRRAGRKNAQFLILGSASLELLKQSSESLAGRIIYVTLSGFKPTEVSETSHESLWLRGGFPDSFLAENDVASFTWRQSFISTYLERDIPQLGAMIPASTLRNFWTMLAHVQGGILNQTKLATGLGLSVPTIKRYVDLLDDLFLIRKLQPWSANTGKRLIRTPKAYIRDSGLVHALLRIKDWDDLLSHPVVGSSWEGFVIESLISDLPDWASPFFYRTADGAEIDLLIDAGNKKKIAVEIKRSLTPSMSKGFYIGCDDVKASHRYFVYPGRERFKIEKNTTVISLVEMMKELREILAGK